MANEPNDNIRMLRLVQNASVPTVGICMGEMGTPSRILAGKFGAPFTYATFHHERTLAPGQLSFRQMKEAYQCDEINDDTKVIGLVGDPASTFLTPVVLNAALRTSGINLVCIPYRVPREYLSAYIQDGAAGAVKGLIVEQPHQTTIMNS